MLDVHPPEHAAHTRRDFFIHIATIVVGLLIAIGLEQTVEYFHHRHQIHELREALAEERENAHLDRRPAGDDSLAPPTPVPRPCQQLPGSRDRLRDPWLPGTPFRAPQAVRIL
jgi:hypothetical protein